MAPVRSLSFDEFRQLIASELQMDPALVTPEASLVEDLLVDSIRMVDLMLRLEEMGITFPAEAIWDVHTVEDAYHAYVQGMRGEAQAHAQAG